MLSLYEKKRNLINFIVLAIFIFLCLFLSLFHESWRDELQAWNMAKELSPAGLIAQMKYEGHPALWHFILMPFAKAGLPCDVIKLISTAFMSAAVALLLWRSPMPIIIKLLAVFGCAFWYDYAVIARSYSIIPLIMFLLADTYRQRAEKPLRYGLCLAALVQTHVIMIFFAGFLSLFFMVESFCHYRREICVFSDVREREREAKFTEKASPQGRGTLPAVTESVAVYGSDLRC